MTDTPCRCAACTFKRWRKKEAQPLPDRARLEFCLGLAAASNFAGEMGRKLK